MGVQVFCYEYKMVYNVNHLSPFKKFSFYQMIILSLLKLILILESAICNFTVTCVYLRFSANEGYRQADMRCAELGSRVDELTYNNSMLEGQLSDNQNRAHSAETDLHSLQQHLKDKDLEIKVMATTMTLLCPLISFYLLYIVRKYEESLLIQIYASVADTKLHIAPNIHIAPHSIMGSRKNYMHILVITLTGGALQIASGKSLRSY